MPPTRIWFNHAVEAPPCPEAVQAVRILLRRHAEGPAPIERAVRARLLDAARESVARLLGGPEGDVVFTSSGTEAANLAIKGAARARRAASRRIVTTAVEHLGVLHPVRSLAREGFEPVFLPVDPLGRVDPAAFESALRGGAALASVQFANPEVGALQPVTEIVALARRHGVPLHCDAAAVAGLLPLDLRALEFDLLSLSAARLGGFPGAGALFVRSGVRLLPLIEGGTQEGGRRAGGENLLGIVALGAAAAAAAGREAQRGAEVRALRDRLEEGLRSAIPGTTLHGPPAAERLPGHLPAAFTGAEGEALLLRLSRGGLDASTGSACAQEAGKPSHVLEAMGIGAERAACAVLFSLGPGNVVGEVDRALQIIPEAVAALRRIGGSEL